MSFVEKFSNELIDDKKYVLSYLQHLELLDLKKRKRSANRVKRSQNKSDRSSDEEGDIHEESESEDRVIVLMESSDSSPESDEEVHVTRSGRRHTTYRCRHFFGNSDTQ